MVKTKFRLAVIPHIPLILAFKHGKTGTGSAQWGPGPRHRSIR